MPRRSKGPRLWLQRARHAPDGRLLERSVWCILDRGRKFSTGFGPGQIGDAELALASYLLAKRAAPRVRDRHPAQVKIAEVISVYCDDVLAKHARPQETARRLGRILDFF